VFVILLIDDENDRLDDNDNDDNENDGTIDLLLVVVVD
jgi:hypothetical protein